MDGKSSFVLYTDLIFTVEKLSDEQSGKLLKHLLRYVNDKNPVTDDPIIDLVFEPIKQTLKRDLEQWKLKCERRAKSGKAGGISSGKSRRNKANEANASKSKQTKQNEANEADSVTVTVSDSVIINYISNLGNVKKLQKQLTEQEAKKLLDTYGEKLVKDVLDSMENYKSLLKSYTSVYLTCNNWCKKRASNNSITNSDSNNSTRPLLPLE